MSGPALATLTALTLTAFAANSLLCRAALAEARIDPTTFTALRLAAGVAMLALLVRVRREGGGGPSGASWRGGAYLFGYAILFSLAYEWIPAGVGALVLFAFVQLTMLTAAVRRGGGPRGGGWIGVALALGGLAWLTLPGAEAPDWRGLLLMAGSGAAWGLYSLAGAKTTRPVPATAGNFSRAAVIALPAAAVVILANRGRADAAGIALAAVSGAVASGLGYVLWYAVLPQLGATRAAVLQLAVPVIAAFGGILVLGEAATTRLAIASAAILGGIGVVLAARRRR